MYIFITSIVSNLFKNMKLALYLMNKVHLYVELYTQLFFGLFLQTLITELKNSKDVGLFPRFFFSSDLFSSGLLFL